MQSCKKITNFFQPTNEGNSKADPQDAHEKELDVLDADITDTTVYDALAVDSDPIEQK